MKALDFEKVMRLFFGNKAYGIAGSINNKKAEKKWLIKLIKEITRRINDLDTVIEHKQYILNTMGKLQDIIKEEDEATTWNIACIITLFRFCGQLLGYSGIHQKPLILYTPVYYQNENQYNTIQMLKKDQFPLDDDKKDVIAIKADIALQLHNQGLNTFKIGKVLNISEKNIKELMKLNAPIIPEVP